VGIAIDFATQHLLGTAHCQRRNLLTQFLAGAMGSGGDFRLGSSTLTLGLSHGIFLGFVDDLIGTRMRLLNDLVGLATSILEQIGDARLCLSQVLVAAIRRRQTLAAARPSAIFFCRSSMAVVNGGQINFIVNQMSIANDNIWPKKVMLISMTTPVSSA